MTRESSVRRLAAGIGLESLGVIGALVCAAVAVAHIAASDRGWILFYDGDSALLPLIAESLATGGPLHWAMSTTLFIPEVVLYLLSSIPAQTTQQAIAVNALINVVVFYALARAAAGLAWPTARRTVRIGLASGSIAVFAALVLLESSSLNNTFELFSLNLTGTYYSTTVMATCANALLVAVVLGRSRSVRTRIAAAAGLVVIVAAGTLSSPILLVWSVAPLVVVLLVAVLARRVGVRFAAVAGAALLAGSALGLVLRIPFASYVSADAVGYLRLFNFRHSLGAYRHAVETTWSLGPTGAALILAIAALGAFAVAVAIRSWQRGDRDGDLLLAVLPGLTGVALVIGAVVTGQDAPRYLLPGVFLPVFLAPALARALVSARRRPRLPSRLVAIVAAVALGAGVVVAPAAAVAAVGASRYDRADCLDAWAADHPGRVGVGEFWFVRALDVYTSDEVRLLQVRPWLETYAWMVDLEEYDVAEISYIIVEDSWDRGLLRDTLGEPADIVGCGEYSIWDYQGTDGAATLTSRIVDSAAAELARRGW